MSTGPEPPPPPNPDSRRSRWKLREGEPNATDQQPGEQAAAEPSPEQLRLEVPAPSGPEEEAETLDFESKREEPEMDVTPMVDVVFQLLIFFMITASFSLQKSLQFPRPQDDKPSANVVPKETEEEAESIIVFVDANDTYRIETSEGELEAPSEQDLIVRLKGIRAGDGSGSKAPSQLVVKAHGDAHHGKVVSAVDAATAVGMDKVKLQTVESDDE